MMERVCEICGMVFTAKRATVCSTSCRCRRYAIRNRDKELARRKAWYYREKSNNYARLRATNQRATQKYKKANSEFVKEQGREYQKRTRQSVLLRELKYFGGNRPSVLRRDDYRCVDCGNEENLIVHHIDGSKGKNNEMKNLVTLCRRCHPKRHKKMMI